MQARIPLSLDNKGSWLYIIIHCQFLHFSAKPCCFLFVLWLPQTSNRPHLCRSQLSHPTAMIQMNFCWYVSQVDPTKILQSAYYNIIKLCYSCQKWLLFCSYHNAITISLLCLESWAFAFCPHVSSASCATFFQKSELITTYHMRFWYNMKQLCWWQCCGVRQALL